MGYYLKITSDTCCDKGVLNVENGHNQTIGDCILPGTARRDAAAVSQLQCRNVEQYSEYR